jgi:hypothetical protein
MEPRGRMRSDELLLRSRHSVGSESKKVKQQQLKVKSDRDKEQGQRAEKPNALESEEVKEQQLFSLGTTVFFTESNV